MEHNTLKQRVGKLGEDVATRFLVGKGYFILERNYLKPYGEIDIVCNKDEIVHFVEVKAVSQLTSEFGNDKFRAEDNVHDNKLIRLSRVIEAYIEEKGVTVDWQLDIITVIIDSANKTARVKMISDIVIGA